MESSQNKKIRQRKAKSVSEAEKNARLRDIKIENKKSELNGVSKEAFDEATRVIAKASGKDVVVFTKKSPASKIKFVQFIQDNWNYALENNYFTDEEMLFLLRIQRFLQLKSNCIVDNIHSKSAIPMSQQQIAKRLGTSAPTVSRIVKGLMNKGVIVRAQGQKIEGNNVRTYALFINPNIIYCGDRDNVETTLKALFTNSKKLLKDFPIALF